MRKKTATRILAAVCLIGLLPAGANADVRQDMDLCRDEKDGKRALLYCTRAIESGVLSKSELATTLYNRAIAYAYYTRQRREAIADFTRVLELDPNDMRVWNQRGRIYRRLGEYDRAIADFTRAIALRPDYAPYVSNRGLAYKTKGDYRRALADYDAAVRIDPDNDITLHNRGELHRKMKNYRQAYTDLKRSLELDSDDASTMVQMGRLHADQRRHADALRYYDAAIKDSPEYKDAWLWRGLSYRAMRRPGLARRDLGKAYALGARDPELLQALSELRAAASTGTPRKSMPKSKTPIADSLDLGDFSDF